MHIANHEQQYSKFDNSQHMMTHSTSPIKYSFLLHDVFSPLWRSSWLRDYNQIDKPIQLYIMTLQSVMSSLNSDGGF